MFEMTIPGAAPVPNYRAQTTINYALTLTLRGNSPAPSAVATFADDV
jgi:hypothetical protein